MKCLTEKAKEKKVQPIPILGSVYGLLSLLWRPYGRLCFPSFGRKVGLQMSSPISSQVPMGENTVLPLQECGK